ncbi:25S rRNA (uracil2843-N3)-methyltransferase [Alternaria panax]|uniref:25S rRNA (Uracil2843-N3)-methyltransferase n=1 Tax=Alternaria panax TaxID=48097 RepID=A0AAD4IB78_9PLEO|nr:25S rRNA (uracil2843-N3)-methyltransferase [Alternaria panax]
MAPNSKLNAKRKAQREGAKPAKPKIDKRPSSTAEVKGPGISYIPIELQQLLLNIFRNSFAERLSSDFGPLLQEVKGHLYNRDFATAFGKNEYLETYAARWSPSRALGYLDLIWEWKDELWADEEEEDENEAVDKEGAKSKSRKVVCLGGGAGAEIVALGGMQKLISDMSSEREGSEVAMQHVEVAAIDVADWSAVVEVLANQLTTAPTLNKYASAAAKAANVPPLKPEDIAVKFKQQDVLQASAEELSAQLVHANIVTLLFTLNELYSASMPLTQKFLLHLTSILQPGAFLLVVDSPGSYSSVTLNGAEKKYPMQWLLDHTLLEQATENRGSKDEIVRWEKIKEDGSRWYRLDERLRYPIELENMRMQAHLYRKI